MMGGGNANPSHHINGTNEPFLFDTGNRQGEVGSFPVRARDKLINRIVIRARNKVGVGFFGGNSTNWA